MNDERTISRGELDTILKEHHGNEAFKNHLESCKGEDVLRVLARYIHWNRVFGACVANLASRIALEFELFTDKSQPLGLVADRSVEVSRHFFFAAIDEFGERSILGNPTHRQLAQNLLIVTCQHFGYDPTNPLEVAHFGELTKPNPATLRAVEQVKRGYGATSEEAGRCFRSMGFHIGSELLADVEFRILDEVLCRQFPELVKHIGKVNCYRWVSLHTSVEADHFVAATEGANLALKYCSGEARAEEIKELILEGFAEFAHVQEDFMCGLLEE